MKTISVATVIRSKIPRGQRWLRVRELPLNRNLVYHLINEGLVDSVIIRKPGGKKGVRLIDGDSFDRYLESLRGEKYPAWRPTGRPKGRLNDKTIARQKQEQEAAAK
jgi:hypothetical protein